LLWLQRYTNSESRPVGGNWGRFTDGYVSAPQCAPSRVGLLSGKYQNRLGFEYNVSKKDPKYHGLGFPADEKTVGDLMKVQGYATGIIGK